MAALFALYPLVLLAGHLVQSAPRLLQTDAWPFPVAVLAGTLIAVLAYVAGRAAAALGLLSAIAVLFLVDPRGALDTAGLGVGDRLTWAVLLAASLYIARRFRLLAGEVEGRIRSGYDQWDRTLPMARSVLPLPEGETDAEAGEPAGMTFRTFHALSALAALVAGGGVLALATWHWPDGEGTALPFWATGLFFVLGYLLYLLFDVWQINWLSHRALRRQKRGDLPGGEDETGLQELRGRLRARQLAFVDVLQVLGLPIATRMAPAAPKVIVERATIGHWQMSEPFPDQVDLSNVSVDRWSLGSGDEREKRILRILEHSSEFKRSTYSSIERAQRNQGNRQLADRVHRAMRRQEQWRERRRFATALMLLHSVVGYGTKRAPILAFMAAWYVFTALWFAVDYADAVTLTPETRMSLLEITQDPQTAGALAEALDPGCRTGGSDEACGPRCRKRAGPGYHRLADAPRPRLRAGDALSPADHRLGPLALPGAARRDVAVCRHGQRHSLDPVAAAAGQPDPDADSAARELSAPRHRDRPHDHPARPPCPGSPLLRRRSRNAGYPAPLRNRILLIVCICRHPGTRAWTSGLALQYLVAQRHESAGIEDTTTEFENAVLPWTRQETFLYALGKAALITMQDTQTFP